ncbi:MAG TPA: hypothetical protein VK541_04865 [Pedobacter sp.]|uniref:hypothetical protein n=1 Tax=Pedobacter sp. TaxID=1411316 RepID=UPI002CFC5C8E|nr:hypothetical protein [Pedobacter sp.]HMI01790.1 hypothetical protein [Pedobacter sp.]
MSYYQRTCLAVLAFLCLEISVNTGTAVAQVQTGKTDKTNTDSIPQKISLSVAVQPFFLLSNAGKIDVELQPAGSKFGYVLTAEVYGGRVKDRSIFSEIEDDAPYDKISGAGIGISQKYRFKDKRSSPYIAYGLTYRYQEIAIETEGFYQYQENGLTYYDYGPIGKNLVISSGLASAVFGYQKIADDFVYDLYFGFGYKAQLKNTDFDDLRQYDKYQYSHAYKGPVMLLGFKIGFQFQ